MPELLMKVEDLTGMTSAHVVLGIRLSQLRDNIVRIQSEWVASKTVSHMRCLVSEKKVVRL